VGELLRKRYLKIRREYEDAPEGPVEEEEEENQQFALEAHLRDFLAQNPETIEPGLRLYQQGDERGVEFSVDDGRIDILALDRKDRFVVIELKVNRGRNKALGQLLYYMGWVDKHLGKGQPCRGFIVASDIPEDLMLAAQRVPGVSLLRYKLSVSVEPIYKGS
jgi:endonuclease